MPIFVFPNQISERDINIYIQYELNYLTFCYPNFQLSNLDFLLTDLIVTIPRGSDNGSSTLYNLMLANMQLQRLAFPSIVFDNIFQLQFASLRFLFSFVQEVISGI